MGKYKIFNLKSTKGIKPIVIIKSWNGIDDLIEIEDLVFKKTNAAYLYCEVNSADIRTIHLLEDHGYRYSEFKIFSTLSLTDFSLNPNSLYPYVLKPIFTEIEFKKALKILTESKQDDRFIYDPCIDIDFAIQRNIIILTQSFKSKDEFILGVYNAFTNEIIGFKSGIFLSKSDVQYSLTAISNAHNNEHFLNILELLCIDYFYKNKARRINVYTSGLNISEMDRLIRDYNFKINKTKVILRKLI